MTQKAKVKRALKKIVGKPLPPSVREYIARELPKIAPKLSVAFAKPETDKIQ
jgi:hypothetical protein